MFKKQHTKLYSVFFHKTMFNVVFYVYDNENCLFVQSANMAMAALVAADAGLNADQYRHWAMCQIHYALGDTGFSYLIGFGDKYPHSPHHRAR